MSAAMIAVVPLQDCMNLGTEARMNMPGAASGNWTWRFLPQQLAAGIDAGLAEMAELYGRAYVSPENRVSSPHAA